MNKRFSTLLAAALVAGGLSSTAMATGKILDTTKYYHVALSGDAASRVIIGHSEDGKRDSVAIVKADDIKLYEDFNATLWKPTVEQKVNAAGGVYYEIKLVNKDGQELSVSKKDVKASQTSFYKAKYAYISSTDGIGKMGADESVVSIDKDGKITFHKGPEARTNIYDAEAGKMYQYALVVKDNAVKVMMAEGTPTEAPTVTPADGKVMSLYLIDATADASDSYKLTVDDLSKDVNDSFELKFSNDVKNNAFENPFTANKLRAVGFDAIYTSATSTSTFKADLAAAKKLTDKAFTEMDAAIKACEAEIKTAIDYVQNNEVPAGSKLGAAIPNTVDFTGAIADLDKAKQLYFNPTTTTNGTVQDSLNAANAKLKALADTTFVAAGKLPKTSKLLADYKTAAAQVKNMLAKVKKETNQAYHDVDSIMNDYMVKPYLAANEAPKFDTEKGKASKALFATATAGNLVFDQFQTGAATTIEENGEKLNSENIQSLLTAIYSSASATGFVTSKDILSETPSVSEFIKAANYYAIAIVDSLIEGKQAYLCVDTNYVAEKEQYFTFRADTLHAVNEEGTEVVPALGQHANLFAFQLTVNPELIAGDEVTIKTFMPTATAAGKWYSEGITPKAAQVVIRSLANNTHREVSVATSDDPATKNTKITFKSIEGPKPAFEIGDVFFIKSLKKADARKPYRVMTSTTGDDIVGATAVYNSVPATQWIVTAANKLDGTYQLANRDANKNFFTTAPVKIIVKDAEKNIYIAATANKDTLEITAVPDQKDEYLGYKHINDADKDHLTFKLTATNFVNPEAKYYLTMGADSSVVATADADKALELKAKNNGSLFKLNDTNLSAASYGFEMYLGEDTLYFRNTSTDGNDLMLTKVATKDSMKLRRVNDNASQYELLWNVVENGNLESEKIAIDQNGNVVVVAEDEITNWAFNLESAVTESYLNITDAPKNITISLMGDEASKVTAVKPFAVIKRTGLDLKAAATDNDFVLGLDTAYVNRPNNYRYAYYITKPVDTAKVGAFDTKAYMVSYADSVAHNSDTVKYNQDGLTRIGFVHANRVEFGNNDSLAIAKPAAKSTDTLNIVDKKGITPATWAFPIDENNEGYYRIEVAPAANKTDKTYVSYLNGVLVLGNKEQAQLFAINDTDLTPTDNEKIATSEVTVIAGEGQVTIAGAAGKKVVISNILGQVVANTVIASDNAVIAAPQGVVVVAVEGEEAVKAIIK
ncbi:DUF6383 domain-containing protein [uncultured Parabacteroides sp.]|uniref:DUF6383 domain-containing protein n=1 Tax=uncultured Parabacteroides sp. TaxID=512312 RepID=UPI002659ECB8|nr:DUF6383 domain-containing protein [uncultured Parabacteroides sp.]